MLEQAAKNIFGAPNVNVDVPDWLTGSLAGDRRPVAVVRAPVHPGPAPSSRWPASYFYLFRTRTGRLVRAVMQNRAMADCLGVRTDRVDALDVSRSAPAWPDWLARRCACSVRSDRSSAPTTSSRRSWSWCSAASGQLIGHGRRGGGIGGLSIRCSTWQFSVSHRPGDRVRRGDRLPAVARPSGFVTHPRSRIGGDRVNCSVRRRTAGVRRGGAG